MPIHLLDPLREFPWSANAEKAALLIADGQTTQGAVGKAVGVHRDTIRIWLQHPDFRERVKSIIEATRQSVLETGILSKQARVAAMQDSWQRLRQIIDERAEAPEYQEVAGGTTGLLAHKVKMIGAGENASRVDEFELDAALLGEMRALLKQIAMEQGQWVERQETEHKITKVEVIYEDIPIETP